ncbi:MAG: copper resistance CopC family protein [Nitrospira sp.]|nr:copper resistance protein CopC [Candidatus Manganitrophaceae bacterium]HIL35349.1 copper resistance protein CopC [Candidatus Manganitrophaceae bacterium]
MLLTRVIVKRFLLSLSLGLIFTIGAWGHVFPVRSDPKVGSEINEPPTLVRIWFDGPLEAVFSEMKLFDAEGDRIDQGKGKVVLNDPTLLSLPLQQLAAGLYQVRWTVVAKDGHRSEGDFSFRIR